VSETTQDHGQGGEQPGRPGRYQSSAAGLIGAMIVMVLVVLAFVVFRGAFRDNDEYDAPDLDYRDFVASIQQLGLEPVYPPELPKGWTTKDASYQTGERPVVDLVFTTDDGHTAGIHRGGAGEHDLLVTYVGEGVTESQDSLGTDLASWTGWVDTDGDHAWTAHVGDDTVLVYSSGDPDELLTFVQSLTTEKLTA
jgi:hypothetical protein